MKNDHITDFLNHYCKLSVAPEYAVLIKGAWGCGKSFFIQEFIKDFEGNHELGIAPATPPEYAVLIKGIWGYCKSFFIQKFMKGFKGKHEGAKFLTVSLYGMSSLEDIKADFFRQLYPVLSGKTAGIFEKIFKMASKWFGWDFDAFKLVDYFTKTEGYILIFDDLERATIDRNILLGFINQFVEKNGYKVIIIANDTKFFEDGKQSPHGWHRVKEKLIGKSFEIEADVAATYDKFVNDVITCLCLVNDVITCPCLVNDVITCPCLKKILAREKDNILTIFHCSKYNNLRSLRKLLMDFERFFLNLELDIQKNEEVISAILKLFTMFSMEIYAGEIAAGEISKFYESHLAAHTGKNDASKKYSAIEEKYKARINLYEPLLKVQIWDNLFHKGIMDRAAINDELKQTRFFSSSDMPDWQKLWNFHYLGEEEFGKLHNSVWESLENRQFTALGEIQHLYGIFLELAEFEVITETISDIVALFENYIKALAETGKLPCDRDAYAFINRYDVDYHGMMFRAQNTEAFRTLTGALNVAVRDSHRKNLVGGAKEILYNMQDDPKRLVVMLSPSPGQSHLFQDSPILQDIDIADFVETFCNMSNADKPYVASALAARFKEIPPESDLIKEKGWLEQLDKALKTKITSMDKGVTKLKLKKCSESIQIALKSIDAYKKTQG
ncbi:MAG: P-loop NTPase fold protein [Alphaproteobacteria bacterium]